MRTTVRLDDDLLREAKRVAAEEGRTLTSLLEDGLREQAPGVTEEDLMSNSRMLDIMDGPD